MNGMVKGESAMFSKEKRPSKWILILLGLFVMTPGIFAQNPRVFVTPKNFVEPAGGDPARELFNDGQNLFDQSRYGAAERTFRDVVEKYPKSTIADKAEYYLIRTLVQSGKTNQALNHINTFRTMYPKSPWNDDVEDLRMRLTNQVPPAVRAYLIRRVPAPAPAPTPPAPGNASAPAAPSTLTPVQIQNLNFEIGLLQEALRVMFQSDLPSAVQIVSTRLKTNMADPVVLSSMSMLATTAASQGLPFLIDIAKNSPSPKGRQDAVYWISKSSEDKSTTVDTLMGLLPSLNEDTSRAVPFALAQMRTDKAYNALAAIVTDKNRSDKLREQALVALGQNRDPRAVTALENITTGDSDPRYRTQALQLLENLLRRR
jgi:hypothetical protein